MLNAREGNGWPAVLLVPPAVVPFVWGPASGAVAFFVFAACVAVLGLLAPLRLPATGVFWLLVITSAAVVSGAAGAGAMPPAPLVCLLGMFFCAGVGGASLQQPSLARALMLGIAVAAGFNSLAGLLQYGGWAPQFAPWVYPAAAGEAMGNLRQRNQLATLANMGLVALAWLDTQNRRDTRTASTGQGWLLALVAMLLVIANAASSSRTGMLQLTLLVIAIGLRTPRHLRMALLFFVVYLAAAAALPLWQPQGAAHSLYERLGNTDASCQSRQVLWSNVLHLIAQKPWLGWGWGELDYAHFATLYDGPRFCDILDNAHNLPLHLAVELGLPAAVAICGLFGWMVWRARPWHERDPLRQAAWALLGLIVVHSMLEYPLWYGIFQMVFGLCLGLLWPGTTVAPRRVWCVRLLAGVLGIGLLGAAVEYHRVGQLYLPNEARARAYRNTTQDALRDTWFFRDAALFAELTTTSVTPQNAPRMRQLAARLIHFSPEPRVIEKGLASAAALGLQDEWQWYEARYRAAFPAEFAAWSATRLTPASGGR